VPQQPPPDLGRLAASVDHRLEIGRRCAPQNCRTVIQVELGNRSLRMTRGATAPRIRRATPPHRVVATVKALTSASGPPTATPWPCPEATTSRRWGPPRPARCADGTRPRVAPGRRGLPPELGDHAQPDRQPEQVWGDLPDRSLAHAMAAGQQAGHGVPPGAAGPGGDARRHDPNGGSVAACRRRSGGLAGGKPTLGSDGKDRAALRAAGPRRRRAVAA